MVWYVDRLLYPQSCFKLLSTPKEAKASILIQGQNNPTPDSIVISDRFRDLTYQCPSQMSPQLGTKRTDASKFGEHQHRGVLLPRFRLQVFDLLSTGLLLLVVSSPLCFLFGHVSTVLAGGFSLPACESISPGCFARLWWVPHVADQLRPHHVVLCTILKINLQGCAAVFSFVLQSRPCEVLTS